jgi:small conductance mechanosensitive channel
VLRAHLLLLVLLAALPAHGQEDAAEAENIEASEPVELPADIAAQFEERIAAIGRQERAANRLRKSFGSSQGLEAAIYGGRLDTVWAAMFDDTVKLAKDIAAKQDDGFDVAEYADDVAKNLSVFPEESADALARLHSGVVFPTDELEPAEFAIQDQYLLLATEKVDFVLQSMVTYQTVASSIGIEDEADIESLATILEESAANRSTFLLLAIENVAVMRAAATALPGDTKVAARLAVSEARVNISSTALQSVVDLMNQLDLDASQYSQQVVTTTGELTSDVLDVGVIAAIVAEWTALVTDLAKTEGPRLLFRLFIVVFILFVFSRLSRVVQSLTKKALSSSRVSLSALLTEMIVATARNLVVLLGILIALSQVGISLGPLLAGLGIAGFIIGFALQDTLSNFASGMLILIYRPFDVGDFVTAGGVTGEVSHMSVVNATFKTIDNQLLVVPNNLIWSSVITNVTAQRLRRVDLVFGVAYSDDIEKVEAILADVVNSHELVLDEPEPMIHLHELADSSVNFVCRPWVKTDDYWDVYWDVLRTVKMRFDAEGITIPFPQREIHTSAS